MPAQIYRVTASTLCYAKIDENGQVQLEDIIRIPERERILIVDAFEGSLDDLGDTRTTEKIYKVQSILWNGHIFTHVCCPSDGESNEDWMEPI